MPDSTSTLPIRERMLALCALVHKILANASLGDREACNRLTPAVQVRESSAEYRQVEEIDWACVLNRRWQAVSDSEELKRAVGILTTQPPVQEHIRSVYHRGDEKPLSLEQIREYTHSHLIFEFVRGIVSSGPPHVWCSESFSTHYPCWEKLILTNTDTLRTTALLQCFRGPDYPIEIESNLRIRKTTDDDLTALAKRWGTHLPTSMLMHHYWLVETEGEVQSGTFNNEAALGRIRRVVAILRLLKRGDVICRETFSVSQATTGRSSFTEPTFRRSGTLYELIDMAEIERLKSLWIHFPEETLLPTGLALALRRFNFGLERESPEDRLVDFVIGLESLYVGGGASGEIGYKLRMRSAALLGRDKTSSERLQIVKQVQTSYNVRSILVHGGDQAKLRKELSKLGLTNVEQLAEIAEELLRQSILLLTSKPELTTAGALDGLLLSLSADEATAGDDESPNST